MGHFLFAWLPIIYLVCGILPIPYYYPLKVCAHKLLMDKNGPNFC